ncbi:MAG: MgtC/SapB family protein [Pseudomonadota bacterium]|nr:MgtC/SapB family protein [Pseudomonadota bacterium]
MDGLDGFISVLMSYWSATEVAVNFVVCLNIFGALILGLFVGYERSYRGRAAGMRTYGMVCMASCALTVISGYPEHWFGGHASHIGNIDPGRIMQGITTGIGFLGAGVIMRDGFNISGLTTAASIWAVSAIGVLVGIGFYSAAVSLALMAGLLMLWGGKIESVLPARHALAVTLHFHKGQTPSETNLHHMFLDRGYEVARGSFAVAGRSGQPEWRFVVVSLGKGRGDSIINLSTILSGTEGLESFHLTHARN